MMIRGSHGPWLPFKHLFFFHPFACWPLLTISQFYIWLSVPTEKLSDVLCTGYSWHLNTWELLPLHCWHQWRQELYLAIDHDYHTALVCVSTCIAFPSFFRHAQVALLHSCLILTTLSLRLKKAKEDQKSRIPCQVTRILFWRAFMKPRDVKDLTNLSDDVDKTSREDASGIIWAIFFGLFHAADAWRISGSIFYEVSGMSLCRMNFITSDKSLNETVNASQNSTIDAWP